jgi:hypothetical protein
MNLEEIDERIVSGIRLMSPGPDLGLVSKVCKVSMARIATQMMMCLKDAGGFGAGRQPRPVLFFISAHILACILLLGFRIDHCVNGFSTGLIKAGLARFICQVAYIVERHETSCGDGRMRIMLILLMALCLAAFSQAVSGAEKAQNVGGDFGRAWLDNLVPKGNESEGEGLLTQSEDDFFMQDWLNITALWAAKNGTKDKSLDGAKQEIPFSVSKTITPIHQIDASWNQTRLMPQQPQPDKSGLINGIPAETYYAIGPAYFSL